VAVHLGQLSGPYGPGSSGFALRWHHARAHNVEGDAVLAHLAGDRLRCGDDGRLGARVHGFAKLTDPAGVGCDGDDAAAPSLGHGLQHGARAVEKPPEVDVDLMLPLIARLLEE